jgi:ribonuclease BN (tRNA processing enzyme)
VALYYVLKFGRSRSERLPVWVPPGGQDFLDRFGQLIADKPRLLEDVFFIREYPLGQPVAIGSLEFTFVPVQHYVPSHAMRVCGAEDKVLTFSSDVAPCQGLLVAARNADLFMCESALLNASQDNPDPASRGHMSALEAGQAASAAGARRLLITHYRSSQEDDAHHLAAARGTFSGPVELARPGASYTV